MSRARKVLEIVAWTLAFSLAYAQSPLYTSNQNQYFLHGLARAGVGYLRDDWLAGTLDPTPLFSWIVQVIAASLPSWTFYLLYGGLMGVYLFSLLGIASAVFDLRTAAKRTLVLAGLVLIHSAALRYVLARLVLPEAEFVLEGGVAGQRLLGAVLQPSTFGIFLVVSLALYLHRRPYASVLALGVAAAFHPTYLLSAGVLLATFVAQTALRQQRWRESASMAILGFALLAPVAGWAYLRFRPSGADLYAVAADILIRLRIPHHAIPVKWLDGTVGIQALIVLAAIVLARRSRLSIILVVGVVFVALTTAVQLGSASPTLALLFPWRLSTVLVPVSTACLLAAAIVAIVDRLAGRPQAVRTLVSAGTALVVLASAAGMYRFLMQRQTQRADPAAPMMDFVAATVGPGEIYLVDPKLQDFRLRTGAPIVVDAKAIPYRDEEVTAWFDRLKVARNLFRPRLEWLDCPSVDTAHERYGATHVVGPEQIGPACQQLEELYNDGTYAVYRIREIP